VEEHLFAIVAADEAEAAVPHHLLDATLRLRALGHHRPTTPPPSPALAARARGAVAVSDDELLAEEVHGHDEVLQPLGLGREQHLVIAEVDDAVAETRILVRHPGTRVDVFE
jgi:hypothetical protein